MATATIYCSDNVVNLYEYVLNNFLTIKNTMVKQLIQN